jgi:heme exporter protein C
MIIKVLLSIWMAVIISAAFLYAGAAAGFPGQTSRILFFHVPQAWIATLSFLLSMIASCMYLARRSVKTDHLA